MNELERTTIMKRPATVVDTRPVLTITAPYHRKADLATQVSRLTRSGQVRPLSARATYNERTGLWEQRVLQLRPPAPAWIKPAIIAGIVLITLAVLGGLAWWVLVTLTSIALALFLLAALVALAVVTRAGKRQSVTIVNNNYVRMR